MTGVQTCALPILMDAANLIENERVSIYDITNGNRFDTYVIKGARQSGVICLNGAAARKVAVDDLIIIVSYATMDFAEAKSFKPQIIFPDKNRSEEHTSELQSH